MKILAWLVTLSLLLISGIRALHAQDDGSSVYIVPQTGSITLFDIAAQNNICFETLLSANAGTLPDYIVNPSRGYTQYSFFYPVSPATPFIISPHEDCYIAADTHMWQQLPQIEAEYNVCLEDFYHFIRRSEDGREIAYLRKDARPCFNEEGHRLLYYMAGGEWQVGDYSATPVINAAAENIMDLGYCLGDLAHANPIVDVIHTESIGTLPYTEGMSLFVPEKTRRCEFVPGDEQSLYQISQQQNVCMEAILDASGISLYDVPLADSMLSIPLGMPPCYDEMVQRLNVPAETLYRPQEGDFFLEIARRHNICMDALWDANPVMNQWDGWSYRLPDVIFVPVEKSCAFTMQMTSHSPQTFLGLALLTNVCRNRLYELNPHLDPRGDREYHYPNIGVNVILAGQHVTIPDRPPCYHLTNQERITQIEYLCYPVDIMSDADFTGHVPPIRSSSDTDLPYCYEAVANMTIVYENERYTAYQKRGYDTLLTISQCFGIDLDELLTLNHDVFSWNLSPSAPVLIPQPHNQDCWMLKVSDEAYYQRYRELTYKAGSLIDGIYTVNYEDTLSGIGRKFGYPYQWIAAANGLSDPYTIYYLQELKMPSYPSFYTLVPIGGGAGVIVLVSRAIYGLRRWRRSRTKKKNS